MQRADARPRLLQAAVDAFRQPDIRQKLLFVFGLLVVFRFMAHVPLPDVDRAALDRVFEENAVLGFFNIFSGGALRNLSVASLGVYPYITASIVMQLLTPLVPRLQALSREGEHGRRQIQIYTHWLTVPIAAVQGYGQLVVLSQTGGGAISGIGLLDHPMATVAAVASMVAGTMFLVWLGELITEKGIGNGVSIIIFGGIVAGLPSLVGQGVYSGAGILGILFLVALVLALIFAIVFFQEAQRRIPVQYSRSMFRGGRMYRQSGQSHIPLRVNSAGMIPLIFAYSIVLFPSYAASYFATAETGWLQRGAEAARGLFSPENPVYWALVFVLVVFFTFFYTVVVFQQQNLAENLQKQGGFIPGIRPGRPTNEYITRVLMRITLAGALFLGLVAIVPYLATGLTDVQALQISSTGLLIVVGVVLDTMRQLEAQLLMRNYEGFIR
ncbi:MAG TPA: preprotein translocase subunit SecY [Dehalococcoidia bacterium]